MPPCITWRATSAPKVWARDWEACTFQKVGAVSTVPKAVSRCRTCVGMQFLQCLHTCAAQCLL